MPSRQKRKRETEAAPPTPSRRRSVGREASGAEPAVGKKKIEDDSEGAEVEEDIMAMDGNQKDPLESDQSNNPLDEAAAKEQGNGAAMNGKSAGEGNDHAEPLKENATVPLHEKEEKQDDATGAAAPSQTINSKKGKQIVSKSAGGKPDSRIQTILSHRKLLLTRLQQGRKVVKQRLEAAYKKNPASKEQNDEQEIIAFQLLAKEATSLARKTKLADVELPGEKRTSLSLRRGSTVGKKMNAALSSLAPGATSIAAAAAAAAVAAAPQPPPVAAPPAPKPVPSAAPAVKTASSSISASSAPIPQAPPSVSISLPKKGPLSKTASKVSRPATSPRPSPAPGVPPPFSHTNLLGTPSRVPQPITNVPDCILLREKRRTIRNKLSALAPLEIELSSSMRDKSKKSINELRRAKQSLPPRRKTHWDYLLEEMRWMATDFKQERNWKVSAARSLSQDLKQRDEVISGAKKPSDSPTAADDDIVADRSTKNAKDTVVAEEDSSEKGKREHDGRLVAKKLSAMIESIVEEYAAVSQSIGNDDKIPEKQSSEAPKEENLAADTVESQEVEREMIYTTITDIAAKASKSTRASRSSQCKVDGTQLHLSREQTKAIALLEDKLSTTASGAILEGAYSSGKTVAALALLSRTNGDGPHLVICSPESTVKWVDRAQYFQHIEVRSLASVLRDNAIVKENNVVLCDFAGIDRLEDSTLNKFKSIVVDCRHPWGYRGSKWAVAGDDTTELASILAEFCPRQLSSVSWWTRLSAVAGTSCARRLIVENKNSSSLSQMLGGLNKKTQLDLIALRLAFVSGIASNKKGHIPLPKLVIGWARKQVKGVKTEGTKFERVARELIRFLDSFACPMSRDDIVEEAPSSFTFDVQKCEMTPLQRSAYEQQCAESRRLLSTSLEHAEANPMLLQQTASCLLRLRRTCFYSELDIPLKSPSMQSTMYALASSCGKKSSASQPNQELASRIMECSGKLSHLASFLSSESSVTLSKETQNLVWRKDGKRKSAKVKHSPMKNKIVILASLPEVQLLVSLFLNSLGIDHELIPDEFGPPLSSDGSRGEGSYRWIRGQTRLTGFNHQNVDDPAATNVVVCSLATVAGDHGGVGVDTADAVICVDEDWSGRNELLFNALLHRFWCALNKTCKFIKLVAANTCEDYFITNGDFGQLDQEDLRWHVSPLGSFVCKTSLSDKEVDALASMLVERRKPESWFGFPGLNIFASTNETLTDVLSTTSPLPRKFGSSGSMELLPTRDKASRDTFVTIVLRLMTSETSESWKDSLVRSSTRIHTQGLLRRLEFAGSTFFTELTYWSESETTESEANAGLSLGAPSTDVENTIEPMEEDLEETDPSKPAPRGSLYYELPGNVGEDVKSRLSNAFVDSFARHTSLGGRSVSEVVPYFPPLFPRMLETSIMAQNNLVMLEASGVKRQLATEPESEDVSKRAREDSSIMADAGAPRNDATTVLLDLADDYGLTGAGALPLPQDSVLAAALEQMEQKNSNADTATTDSMVLIVTRKRQRPGHPLMPPPSQPIPSLGPPAAAIAPFARPNPGTNAVNVDIPTGKNTKKKVTSQQPAPSVAAKFQPAPEDANQLARGHLHTGQHGIRIKEAIRGRFLASSRQSGIGTSIFEVPIFRAAYVRIRHRLRNCTTRDCWHSSAIIDAGPGIPLHACNRETRAGGRGPGGEERSLWTNVVKRLGTDNSGEEAVLAAGLQKAALRKSLSAPHRVDFGPFQSGFLSSPTGMTAIVPPRPRSGVSLPMGVKVPPPMKELHVPWTDQEEKSLQDCVLRFGTNWMLAARSLSGVQDVETVSRQSPGVRPVARAGRSCREHWHAMARKEASLARELRQAERLQREKANHRFRKEDYSSERRVEFERKKRSEGNKGDFDVPSTTDFFVPLSVSPKDSKMADANEPLNEAIPVPRKRRSFSAIAAARTKKVQLSRTIPGVQNGSPPTISPSHPSHMQAVQKSATAKWSGGRTDMWPIQFLDAADRHRNPPQSAVSQQRGQPAPPARNHGSSSTSVTSVRPAYPPGAHRMPPPVATRPATVPVPSVPVASSRPSTNVTMQSFAPPSSKSRQGDDKKAPPK
eukprot:scaffold1271_cov167-Amphora_coffeaeformis.AAC.5